MRRVLLTMVVLLTSLVGVWAQAEDEGRQILVFRNTGEVNLFYSNELDSITLNDTAQVFHSIDTTLIVPLAELDSVAVGSRNEMKFHTGVKELTKSEDFQWIISFDGKSIYYRLETPANILPSIGMKLFSGIDEQLTNETIFPYGLSAKVNNVTKQAENIRVDIETVQLNDIFKKLFLAGSINSSQPLSVPSKQNVRRIPVHANLSLNRSMDIDDFGSIGITGNLEIEGNAVISLNPFHNYSHADLTLTYGFGTNVTLEASENGSYNHEELGRDVRIGTFYKLLNLDAAVGAFADVSAEMNLDVNLQRTYQRRLIWNRNDDENSFEFKAVNAKEPYEDKAQIDLTLKGELFFGPILQIDFATVGDLVGARAKVKFGPKVDGEINLGMIRQMHNHKSEYYGSAKLNLCSQVAVEGFVINRHNLVWGEVDEHRIFNLTFPFGEHEWNLFPQYERGRAVAQTNASQETKMTMATAVVEPTPTPLETGFELVDLEGEIVDSIYVGTIQSQQNIEVGEQFFDSAFVMPKDINIKDLDYYYVRPVFHYAGYTVSAASISISKDMNMQPYSSYLSNGAMTFISSGPFLNRAEQDSTLYTVGAYLPVPPKKLLTDKPKKILKIGKGFTDEKAETLVGTWSGELSGFEVTIVFNEDGTGNFTSGKQNPKPFDYELNTPQMGEVLITFEDDSDLVLLLRFIDNSTLEVINKRDETRTVKTFKRE